VANETIKADQIVEAANLLLERAIVLPRVFWSQPDSLFTGTQPLDDTITLRVPAVRTASSRTMRSNSAVSGSGLAETKVPVQLTKHVYDLLPITSEELTLDFKNFVTQVLNPQLRAVVEGVEDVIAAALGAVTWEADPVDFVEGTDQGFNVLVGASKALNKLNIPRSGRVFVCGANVEAALLDDDKVVKANEAGTDTALREATIARLAGFTVVGSNALGEDEAYACHMTAIAFASVAPALPEGAGMAARTSAESLALRYIRDFSMGATGGPSDQSLIDSFVGASSVDDETSETNKRGVEINFTALGS
jgi:hypothetical protein